MHETQGTIPDGWQAAAAELQQAFAAEQDQAFDKAEKIYAGLVARHPDFAPGWHYYGLLLHRRNESQKGLYALHQAHQLSPDNPLFLFNVSQVLMDTGDVEQALACIMRAHQLDPDHGQIFSRYAQLMLHWQEQPEIVLTEIEKHLERSPQSWHLWQLAGQWRERAGDKEGAIEAFRKADAYAPYSEPSPLVHLGGLYRGYDQIDEARENFSAALDRDRECGKAYMGLANIAAEEGQFEEARALCRDALAHNPEAFGTWSLLARICDKDEAPQLISDLKQAEKNAGENPARAPIHFALGKVYEDTGEYEPAFEHYAKANELMARFRPYAKENEENATTDICTQVREELLERADSVGLTGSGAVFICGMPRSGTTLVETIVGSHPDVGMGGELRFLTDWLTREKMREGAPTSENIGSWLVAAPDEKLRELAGAWHATMRQLAGAHSLITDKMPENFRNIGLIATCLPDARIIYVHRDPRDNCVSCFTTPFARGHNYSYDLESLGHYYRQHEKLIRHWKETLPTGNILDMTYENLIGDPEQQIRRLIDFLGLPWDPRCLNPDKTERVVATASVHQVRQPIYSSSIGRWRRFEKHLQPLIEALGQA